MTKNRRRKQHIRAVQAGTGLPYLAASRHTAPPDRAAPDMALPDSVTVKPALAGWTSPGACRRWEDVQREHGQLVAVDISRGEDDWDLKELVRAAAGPLHDWAGRYLIIRWPDLHRVVSQLDERTAVHRLVVRNFPDVTACNHPSCLDRREPAADQPLPAVLASQRTLAEVMAQQPHLTEFGIGVDHNPRMTAVERSQQVEQLRARLRDRELFVVRVRDWLLTHATPIKTPTVGSYGLKHHVERAIGEYVTNGELIAAAMMADYPTRHVTGPNVLIGVSKRSVDRARS